MKYLEILLKEAGMIKWVNKNIFIDPVLTKKKRKKEFLFLLNPTSLILLLILLFVLFHLSLIHLFAIKPGSESNTMVSANL